MSNSIQLSGSILELLDVVTIELSGSGVENETSAGGVVKREPHAYILFIFSMSLSENAKR